MIFLDLNFNTLAIFSFSHYTTYFIYLEFFRTEPLGVITNLKERNKEDIRKMDQLLKATAIESVPAFGVPIFTTALLRLVHLGLMRRELNYREMHDSPAEAPADPYDEEVLNEERLIVDCSRMLQYCFVEVDIFAHLKQALLSLALAFPVERPAQVDYVELSGSSSAALMQVFELVHQTLPLAVELLKSCGYEQTLVANTQAATQLVSLYCLLVRSLRLPVARLSPYLMSHMEGASLHPTPEEMVAAIASPPDSDPDVGDRDSLLHYNVLRLLEQTEAQLILSPTIVQDVALLLYPLDVRSFASLHAAIVHRYKHIIDELALTSEAAADEEREGSVFNQLVMQFATNRLHYVCNFYL